MAEPLRADKHFCLYSNKEMISFCNELRKKLALPRFEQELKRSGQETGLCDTVELAVRVLHAFEPEILHKQEPKVYPKGCNYAVRVQVKAAAPAKWNAEWIEEVWLPRWIETLQGLTDQGVVYLNRKVVAEAKPGGFSLGKLFGSS
jgi:hypothetical protein